MVNFRHRTSSVVVQDVCIESVSDILAQLPNPALLISSVNSHYKAMNYWNTVVSHICVIAACCLDVWHEEIPWGPLLCACVWLAPVKCHIEFFIAHLCPWLKWKINQIWCQVVEGQRSAWVAATGAWVSDKSHWETTLKCPAIKVQLFLLIFLF